MVRSLDSGLRHPGLSPDQSHCILFLGKALYSHGASPLRYIIPLWVVYIGCGNFNIGGITQQQTSIPSRWGIKIILCTWCNRNQNTCKWCMYGPLSPTQTLKCYLLNIAKIALPVPQQCSVGVSRTTLVYLVSEWFGCHPLWAHISFGQN